MIRSRSSSSSKKSIKSKKSCINFILIQNLTASINGDHDQDHLKVGDKTTTKVIYNFISDRHLPLHRKFRQEMPGR